jgi:glyoxylate reductase
MKVLVTRRIPDEMLALIGREHLLDVHPADEPMARQELLARVRDIHGLLCTLSDRIDLELLENAGQLRMVANIAVGYDNIDVAAAHAKGVMVSNTPGVLTDATADLTFALILAVARRVVEGDRRTRAGLFKFMAPLLFLGSEVTGKTLGIVGMGQIGQAVARRALGFRMRVIYHNRRELSPEDIRGIGARYVPLDALLQEADFVSLHVPLTEQTRRLIGREQLKLMKPSAFLINVARGPVVDEAALVEALQTGQIAGAGLDVYENEPMLAPGLAELQNAVLLPHMGSATLETRVRMARLALNNLLAGLRGQIPPNLISPAPGTIMAGKIRNEA